MAGDRLSLQVAVVAVVASLPLGWLWPGCLPGGNSAARRFLKRGQSAAGVAAGRDRLFAAGDVRPQRLDRQVLDRWFGVQIIFTWKAAALASAIMAFPLMVRSIRLALRASMFIWSKRPARSAPGRGTRFGRSRCRWPGMGSLPAACWRLPAASANSGRRSWSRATCRAYAHDSAGDLQPAGIARRREESARAACSFRC